MNPPRLLLLSFSLLPLLASAGGDGQRLEYRGEPRALGAHAPGVGAWFPDLAFASAAGDASTLSAAARGKGLVVAMRDPDCPLSKRYSPRLARLGAELAARDVGLLVVNTLSQESAAPDAKEHGFDQARYAVDADQELARALGASTTTEVFLFDAARTLRYRGMLDDQYGLGFEREAPEREYLVEALDAVLAGRAVKVPATQAQGCLYRFEEPSALERPLTWHENVGRILAARCTTCHRDGGTAPFALESYADAVKKKGMIEWVLEDQLMPPWFAAPGSGPWSNDTGMSDMERESVLAWIAGGTPQGDAEHAALAIERTDGWTIAAPDLVVQMPEAFAVPAEGVVDYQYFYAETGLDEERWIEAVEIRPGAREVVHHVLVFLEDPAVLEALRKGDRSARGRFQEGSDGFFASSVPGQAGLVYPKGYGKRLPAGSWLKFQIHYTPNGSAAQDRTEVGFVFAEPGVELSEVHTTSAINTDFAIPPLAFDHEVTAEYRFPEDAAILTLFPHTHLRGSRFLVELIEPGAQAEEFLALPFYDFDWQLNYDLATPRRVAQGTVLRATAWYDNSRENPANPDPEAWVRFGEQTFEEMMIAYVNWVPTGPLATAATGGANGSGR